MPLAKGFLFFLRMWWLIIVNVHTYGLFYHNISTYFNCTKQIENFYNIFLLEIVKDKFWSTPRFYVFQRCFDFKRVFVPVNNQHGYDHGFQRRNLHFGYSYKKKKLMNRKPIIVWKIMIWENLFILFEFTFGHFGS